MLCWILRKGDEWSVIRGLMTSRPDWFSRACNEGDTCEELELFFDSSAGEERTRTSVSGNTCIDHSFPFHWIFPALKLYQVLCCISSRCLMALVCRSFYSLLYPALVDQLLRNSFKISTYRNSQRFLSNRIPPIYISHTIFTCNLST